MMAVLMPLHRFRIWVLRYLLAGMWMYGGVEVWRCGGVEVPAGRYVISVINTDSSEP